MQTRSFCYVDDLVAGLVAMIDECGFVGPVNIGNPKEITVAELAQRVLDTTGTASEVIYSPAPEQDPHDVGQTSLSQAKNLDGPPSVAGGRARAYSELVSRAVD